jgi:hypothetical protein
MPTARSILKRLHEHRAAFSTDFCTPNANTLQKFKIHLFDRPVPGPTLGFPRFLGTSGDKIREF